MDIAELEQQAAALVLHPSCRSRSLVAGPMAGGTGTGRRTADCHHDPHSGPHPVSCLDGWGIACQ